MFLKCRISLFTHALVKLYSKVNYFMVTVHHELTVYYCLNIKTEITLVPGCLTASTYLLLGTAQSTATGRPGNEISQQF